MFEPFLPSSLLETAELSDFSYSARMHNNTSLRVGVVIEIVPVESDDNHSKLSDEFSVMCVQSSSGQPNSVIYKNVIALDSFGGVADYFEFQKRVPTDSKKVSRSGSLKEQVGSIVLLLCLDGSSEKSVIIGSIQHPSRKTNLSKDTFAQGELNGLNWKINDDGGFTVTFKGKTNADGTVVDKKVGGSKISIEKDGSVQISDNSKEHIRLDQTNKTVSITSEKDMTLSTEANINITAIANGNISVKDLIAKATGAANLEATGEISIKAGGNLGVKAASIKIESDGIVNVKGTEIKVEGPSIELGAGGTPAVTMLSKTLGIGFAGTPVISSFIGAFSSVVKIA